MEIQQAIDPINTLNSIWITTIRDHFGEVGRRLNVVLTECDQYQNLANTANGQINNLRNVLQ